MGVVPTLYGLVSVNSGFKSLGTTLLAAPAAAVTFSGISATYKEFIVSAWLRPVNDSTVLFMRLNNDSGANYDGEGFTASSTLLANAGSSGLTSIRLTVNETEDNGAGLGLMAVAVVFKEASGLEAMAHVRMQGTDTAGNVINGQAATRWNNVAALISRFDVAVSSGNLDTGSLVRLEGLVP